MDRDQLIAKADALGLTIAPYTRIARIEEAIAAEEDRLLAESQRPIRSHDPMGGSYAHRR